LRLKTIALCSDPFQIINLLDIINSMKNTMVFDEMWLDHKKKGTLATLLCHKRSSRKRQTPWITMENNAFVSIRIKRRDIIVHCHKSANTKPDNDIRGMLIYFFSKEKT
jgi:hypothetical protein